jgi:small subunit ribosomal protein S20
MANHASALKAHRQSLRRKERNKSNRSFLRTTLTDFSGKLQEGKAQEIKESLPELYAVIDRAVQKKALSKNAAARQKSRLTVRLNKGVANPEK